ncbi:MAG TPA: hypothetical protein VGR63_17555 [Casimicrobiaceae bacterium]|jgi:hypothetical protein|nr:hypothetical protein [Casimicrobiaceae bacterium]
MRPSVLEALRLTAIIVALIGVGACVAPPPAPPADAPATAAKPAPACEPDPYCYRDCMRGYQPAYCRFKCGC